MRVTYGAASRQDGFRAVPKGVSVNGIKFQTCTDRPDHRRCRNLPQQLVRSPNLRVRFHIHACTPMTDSGAPVRISSSHAYACAISVWYQGRLRL